MHKRQEHKKMAKETKKKDKLEELKKNYEILRKKYSLPEFNKLNEEFEIEKIAGKKTDFLLREIRRNIERKTEAFFKLLEGFINPSFASMASLSISKSFSDKEKTIVNENYQSLVGLMLKSAVLDTEYSEKKEVEFIKDTLKDWQIIKKDLNVLMISSEKLWKRKIEESKEELKYFG